VASGEVDVEPGDECVDEIIPAAVERERYGKSKVRGCAGVKVEGEDGGRVGYNSFDFDGIDKRFGERGVLEW
jgi:hypothetical protein